MAGKRQADTSAATDEADTGEQPGVSEDTGPALTAYIVTATRINRVVDGEAAPLGFGERVELDPDHKDTLRWLAAKALAPANPDAGTGQDAEPNVTAGNTGATEAEPNGAGGDGAPSSEQDSDPNQPQAQHASPEA